MIKIDKGIPVPKLGGSRPSKYPFSQMAVGDSFFCSGSSQSNLSTRARQVGRGMGGKFSVRKAVENGVAGFRVWRIS